MILLFCKRWPDVLSYDDLAIQRAADGVPPPKNRPETVRKYRRRFSPYCSVASLYLWAAEAARCRVSRTTRRPKSQKGRGTPR